MEALSARKRYGVASIDPLDLLSGKVVEDDNVIYWFTGPGTREKNSPQFVMELRSHEFGPCAYRKDVSDGTYMYRVDDSIYYEGDYKRINKNGLRTNI